MPKLHEGWAIHRDRLNVVRKVFEEATKVFKAGAHFQGLVKTTTFIDEKDSTFNRTEQKVVDDTVPSKLRYVNEHFEKLLDLDFEMEVALQSAKADFIVEGTILAAGLPGSFLLTLENKLKEYREVLEAIPTHAPGIKWERDTSYLSNGEVFKAEGVEVTYSTKKVPVYQVVVQADEHHPAQVKESHDDIRVSKTESQRYTGSISPAEKSDILARCDALMRAAKRARQRANNEELPRDRVARRMLEFLITGRMPATATFDEDDANI